MKRVLVIEDNGDNLRLITYVLERAGYSVVAAATGEDGVKKALDGNFAFIVMDIQLPGIDGFEATRRIRASHGDDGIPIIAMTSYAMRGDREKALAAGCRGYIEKPIDPLTVLAEIEKIIG